MERLERFYKIDQLLKEGRPISFHRLVDIVGVSAATLKRDLTYMRDRFNAPIEYDRTSNGYRFGEQRAGPRYELPGLWFSASEIHALLTTLRALEGLQPGLLGSQVLPLVARLRALAGQGDHSWEEIEKRVRIFQPERRTTNPVHFGAAASATLKRRRLWIRHYNRGDDKITEREVSPQRLTLYRDNWYMDVYCHLRQALRSFAVDAIQAAEVRDAKAKEVAAAELDKYLGAGYGIFAGESVKWATLKFSPKAARWVGAQEWHPKQRSGLDADGSLVLEVPYSNDRELVMEILKFGGEVEVVAPQALRMRMGEALREASRFYTR